MTFVRTVLGDIEPEDLGPTYAHEHLVIDGGRPVELYPDFLLADVDKAVAELAPARALGLGAVIDAMPASAGRNVRKLAEISRRSGVHVVAPTGLHLSRYYADDGWSEIESAQQLAARFAADVTDGIDAHDYLGPTIERTEHRAGVIKVAGSEALTDRERRAFEAAAIAHADTGVPILTHCTEGIGALEQLRFLAEHGVAPAHVTLSHTDKVVDRGYHREIVATGAFVEYDQGFRWKAGVRQRHPDAPRLDDRGRPRRSADARDGCCAPGLLGHLRGLAGLDVPARPVRRADARARHRSRGAGRDLRREPGPRVRLRGRLVTESAPRLGGNLTTSVVGSHAHPSWLVVGVAAAGRGELGPVDIGELQDDAVDTALRDQEEAGIDVVSDGEMRRAGFFTAEFYRHLTGLRPLQPERRVGAPGHDQQHRFEVVEPIAAPEGLGVVEEFRYARTRTRRPLKVTIPGPFTLAGRLVGGSVYPNRVAATEAFIPILAAEVRALVAEGATFIQIDEPSPAIHPDAPADFATLFNPVVADVPYGVRLGAHLCFGNYMGRPLAKRSYRPVLDQLRRFAVHELVLEYANREMAELELLAELTDKYDVAAGVIDVKNSYVETPDDVAERIELVLSHVPAERLSLVPDCGFSQTARGVTRPKLRSLVAGRDLVRGHARA